MDEQKVSIFEALYSPLDDEELVEMSIRRSTLVEEAVTALDRVIASRNLNIPAVAQRVAEEQAAEVAVTRPTRATYLLHGLALALSTPMVKAFGFGGAIPVVLAGAFAWWLSVQATKGVYGMRLGTPKRIAALWGLAVLYVFSYLLLHTLIDSAKR